MVTCEIPYIDIRWHQLLAGKRASQQTNSKPMPRISYQPWRKKQLLSNCAWRCSSQETPATSGIWWNQTGPWLQQMEVASLKPSAGEIIQNWTQPMECQIEHYFNLYAKEFLVTEDALNAIECFPVLEELNDEQPLKRCRKLWTLLPLAKHSCRGPQVLRRNLDRIATSKLSHCIRTKVPWIWCDFRANRSKNMVFSLKQLQEKCRE